VRLPLKSMESRFSDGEFMLRFVGCVTDAGGFARALRPDGSPTDRRVHSLRFTLRHWVLWHAFLEASAHARLRVEDVDPPMLRELAVLAGVPQRLIRRITKVRVALHDLGSDHNHAHTKHAPVTWPMLRAVDPVYYGMALLMTARYGYRASLTPEAAADLAALEGVAFQRCGFESRGRWACWLSPRPDA
jgi:hypothetical protein